MMKPSKFAKDVEPGVIRHALEGDRHACEAIYRIFERPVYTLALRICQCDQDAMDVLQETFIQVFTRLHQFAGDAPFWTWLRKVAVNCSLARLRKRRQMPVQWSDPASTAVTNDAGIQMDLTTALGKLPADARAVVWLYDVEGLTHKEIADQFGKSISFSKTQLSRAHARLRDLLEPNREIPCATTATP